MHLNMARVVINSLELESKSSESNFFTISICFDRALTKVFQPRFLPTPPHALLWASAIFPFLPLTFAPLAALGFLDATGDSNHLGCGLIFLSTLFSWFRTKGKVKIFYIWWRLGG